MFEAPAYTKKAYESVEKWIHGYFKKMSELYKIL